MSEPSHRLRPPKLWKKNPLKSSLSHPGPELDQSEHGRPVCLSLATLTLFRIVLTGLQTPSLQSPPGFFKKFTRLFKRPEKVYMAMIFVLQGEVT